MTSQPLSYPCRNAVHRYLGIQKRMDLIKLVPALRKQNKTLGYRLHKLAFSDFWQVRVLLVLGDQEIVIEETANEVNDQNVDVVVEFRDRLQLRWSTTPDKRVEFKNCEKNTGVRTMSEKMMTFYLDRPGMIVNRSIHSIRWEHLRKWKNCIRTCMFTTCEQISTTEWWCELFRKIRAPELHLEHDSTPGVLSKIIEFVNSNSPIGASVTLYNMERSEIDAVVTVPEQMRTVVIAQHPGYDLVVQLEPSNRRHGTWQLTIKKRRRESENLVIN